MNHYEQLWIPQLSFDFLIIRAHSSKKMKVSESQVFHVSSSTFIFVTEIPKNDVVKDQSSKYKKYNFK